MAVTFQTTVSGAAVMIHLPSWHAKDASGLRPVIALHGHGGSDLQATQGGPFAGHLEYLADKGYAVGMVSTGDTWLSATAMTPITNLYSYLITTLGASGTKVGLLGWSKGGGDLLRWLTENPTKVACGYVTSPVSDLDWAEQQAGFQAEIQAQYGGSHTTYLTQGSPRSPLNTASSFRGGPKVLIAHATDDATVPYSQSTGFITAVNDAAVTLRTPDITGDHRGGWTQVKPRESWEFLRAHWS